MENREEIIQQTVTKLQTIQSLEEFKANEEEIIDQMDKYIKSGIDALGDFMENMFSMTPEEQQEKAKVFQDDDFPFEPLVEKEMHRFDSMPGFLEYAEEFGEKMDKMMAPYMNQYSEHMQKVMDTLMGGVMGAVGGMMEGVAQAFGADAQEEEESDTYIFDYDNPDTPVMLYELYTSRTLEELRENKDGLIESLEEQLQSDIWDLEVLTDMPEEDLFEEDLVKIGEMRHRMERLEPEMEKEIERISSLPNAEVDTAKIHKEIIDRTTTKITELKEYLAKINNKKPSEL